MVLSAAISCGRFADAVGTGECPEWQRELTVNQPPHGFAGSSPASPTSLCSLVELRPGNEPPMSERTSKPPFRRGGKSFGKGRPGAPRPAWRDRDTGSDGPVILYGWHTVTMALQNR